jgi:glycosyltransferase involved in cell wall biosynthesis
MDLGNSGIVLIVPVYQPLPALMSILTRIRALDSDIAIIVVNDGSDAAYDATVFAEISRLPLVKLIKHERNLGKGEALKTGFRFYLERYSDLSAGVVTADADGQHLPEDILALSQAIQRQPNCLHLGVRSFQDDIPLRSKLGNRLTVSILSMIYNIRLRDTQTGLRAIPRVFIEDLLQSKRSGYEFELEMLIRANAAGLKIKETGIATIYEDNNRASHFNPILDSMRIYFVFVRFSAISLLSAALDFIIFFGIMYWRKTVFLGLALSRIFSGLFNYQLNKHFTFRSAESEHTLLRYSILFLSLGFSSYYLIVFLRSFNINIYMSKIIAETFLFGMSFTIQKYLVFKRKVES